MSNALRAFALLFLFLAAPADAGPRRRSAAKPHAPNRLGAITLDGERTEVRWSDGDSFKVKSGRWAGRSARLEGYNTLEAYGPVHFWGDWEPEALSALAKEAAPVAAAGEWACTTQGKPDGYGRLLVRCPSLAVSLIREGYAMAFAVEGTTPLPGTVEAQAEAMAARRGIWAKGTVAGVVTSAHALGEGGSGAPTAYDRVADTHTGLANKRAHQRPYQTCEWACHETDGTVSCLRYVPFPIRYRYKPACLVPAKNPPGEARATARAAAANVLAGRAWSAPTSARDVGGGEWRVEYPPGPDGAARVLRVTPAAVVVVGG